MQSATGTMADMAIGKKHPPPSDEKVRELDALLSLLAKAGWTPERIGPRCNVSPAAVRKWRRFLGGTRGASASFPGHGPMDLLRALADRVRAGEDSRAAVTPEPTKRMAVPETALRPVRSELRSPVYTEALEPIGPGGDEMGELIRLRVAEIPNVRYPELELCLWYNREDVAAHEVGPEVIEGARLGRFEAAGCAAWDGPRWWKELVAAERRFSSAMSEAGSGTHKTVPVAPPEPPHAPKRPRKR